MKQKSIIFLSLGIGLALALGLAAGLAWARDEASTASETAPTVVSYQGEVLVDDQPYNGTGYFKFAVVNTTGNTTYWSNDGSSTGGSEPTSAEVLSVSDGLFAVLLGNPNPPYNMPPITASVFADKGRRLHVWFDADGVGTFTDLDLTAVAAAPYALNAETLDGKDGSYYDQRYEHVIVVAKSGGEYTTVSDALNSISDNDPTSRYLVWVAPGVYTETVTMKEYVDIEGAGELLTTISSSGSSSFGPSTVLGADNAELRFLTVRNTGGNTYAVAVINTNTSPHLTHLTISVAGATNSGYGVYNEASSLTMINVSVSASGPGDCAGVYNTTSSTPTMTDVTASASCSSETYGVKNSTSSPTMIDVIATASGTGSNYGVYNSNSSSPTMVDVTASGLEGVNSYGVYCYSSSSPNMTRVIASGSGASSYNYGVYNSSSSSPTMVELIASASGGSHNYGVFNSSSTVTIQNSTLTASGATGDRSGLYNHASSGAYTVRVDNCQIKGDTYSIDNDSDTTDNYTTYVGASLLDGAVTGDGTETCAFSYDETYIALSSICQ